MTPTTRSYALVAVVLCLAAGHVAASDTKSDAARQPAAVHAVTPAEAPLGKPVRKPLPVGKLVDINSASKAALKKLPGITDELADKIIANRPYGSKTWLASNGVLDGSTYYAIRTKIEARQPFASGAENVAYLEKMKKAKQAKP